MLLICSESTASPMRAISCLLASTMASASVCCSRMIASTVMLPMMLRRCPEKIRPTRVGICPWSPWNRRAAEAIDSWSSPTLNAITAVHGEGEPLLGEAVLDHLGPALSPRLALLEAGASGIAAAGAAARAHFERALALPAIDRWPFDLARVKLAYGEQLRRTRATTDARVQLTAALTMFERLGAPAWADRARNELRATGVHRNARQSGDSLPLTAQQLQIAQLAASGLTNKQIGERLYLSPRTVGGHLYQIFPKLGVTTRAALRDALGGDDGDVRT